LRKNGLKRTSFSFSTTCALDILVPTVRYMSTSCIQQAAYRFQRLAKPMCY
jgi:hypothetical protein